MTKKPVSKRAVDWSALCPLLQYGYEMSILQTVQAAIYNENLYVERL